MSDEEKPKLLRSVVKQDEKPNPSKINIVTQARMTNIAKYLLLSFVVVVCGIVLGHMAIYVMLMSSYANFADEEYSEARRLIVLTKRLSQIPFLGEASLQNSIDEQYAIAHAVEYPSMGVYSALRIKQLFDDKKPVSEKPARDLILLARRSNIRSDIGASSILEKRISNELNIFSPIELAELKGEVAYDQFREIVFSVAHKAKADTRGREYIQTLLEPIKREYEVSQGVICEAIPHRCEINKLRWRMAECNYKRILSGSLDAECVESVRQGYLENMGYPTRNEIVTNKCIKRFGIQGCSVIIREVPYYMEALVVGFGSFSGE